jgi:hypothetical protein
MTNSYLALVALLLGLFVTLNVARGFVTLVLAHFVTSNFVGGTAVPFPV